MRRDLSGLDAQNPAFRAAISSIRLGILALRIHLEAKAGFNADQPPDDQGRWTDGGGGGEGTLLQPIADWGGYPVDLTAEEALGGHTIDRHVGKSDSYLKARLENDRVNIP